MEISQRLHQRPPVELSSDDPPPSASAGGPKEEATDASSQLLPNAYFKAVTEIIIIHFQVALEELFCHVARRKTEIRFPA